jgi:hypothetical protein
MECGTGTLDEIGVDCCDGMDVFNIHGENVSGHLPQSFTPARILTDLSMNPALCGTITTLPTRITAVPVADATPPLVLSLSNVKLDLAAVGMESTLVGPQVAFWLGNDSAMNHYNLVNALPPEQAYQSCVVLRKGSLTVIQQNFDGGNWRCGKMSYESVGVSFSSQEEWDNCHARILHVEFAAPWQKDVAMAQYDAHMYTVDPASVCGDAGIAYRRRIAAIVWAVTAGGCLLISLVWYCCYEWLVRVKDCFCSFCCCCIATEPGDGVCGDFLLTLLYLGMHAYDMYGDWSYISMVAASGNFDVLKVLGWLLMAPYLFVLLVAGAGLSCWICLKLGGDFDEDDATTCLMVLVCPMITLGVLLPGLIVPAIATKNLATFTSDVVVSPDGCLYLAKLFMAFSLSVQGLLALTGAVLRYLHTGHMRKDLATGLLDVEALIAVFVISDGLFLVLENIPQAIAQTVFWVDGQAMVATKWFVISAIGSIVGAFYAVASVPVTVKAAWVKSKQQRDLQGNTSGTSDNVESQAEQGEVKLIPEGQEMARY